MPECRETFKPESRTADLWQPKWNENQTVLAAAILTPDRNADLLEGTAAGSWSLGVVEQTQGEESQVAMKARQYC